MDRKSLADEKAGDVDRVEDVEKQPGSSEEEDELSLQERKRIIRRVDLRLVTMTGLAYCIALMDRTNLSAAAIAG
jgi:uncharacterized membrane protein